MLTLIFQPFILLIPAISNPDKVAAGKISLKHKGVERIINEWPKNWQ